MQAEKRSFLVTAPVEVELLEFNNGAVLSISPIAALVGSGWITEDGGNGWFVNFSCGDEFPLNGYSKHRNNCIGMIEKHIRTVGLGLS